MTSLLCSICITAYLAIIHIEAVSVDIEPRWGQAAVVINDALYIHGGKTDPYNSYSYTSAPNTNDTLYLPLISSFDASAPPWQLLDPSLDQSSTSSPALAWHTISPFNSSNFLLFGGQPGPNSAVVLTDAADSVYLADVSDDLLPLWTSEPVAWAEEPIRRIHHSETATPSSLIYIVGGERADDSGIAFSEHYVFNPSAPSFTLLPSDGSPPDITGHASVLLPNGTLLVFGGYQPSLSMLLPFSTIWTLDTTTQAPSWTSASVSSASLPSPRRAFAATTISGGMVLIQGGSDAVLQNNFEDGWILDPSQNPMVWTQVQALSQVGARRDHTAVSSGDQVIFCFGYGGSQASSATLYIFDLVTGAFTSLFNPPSSATSTQTAPLSSHTSQYPPSSTSNKHGSSAPRPTATSSSNSGNPTGNDGGDKSDRDSAHRTVAIAVGSTMAALGLFLIAGAGAYYVKRRRGGGNTEFRRLLGSDEYDDGESEHLANSIPVAGPPTLRSRHGWEFGILDSIGLAAALGTIGTRHIPERKDILADEDTREFAPWYHDRSRESTMDRAWSIRSIIPSLRRSRDPSIGSIGNRSWSEKADPFSDEVGLVGGELQASHAGHSASSNRRQQSYISNRSYHDPFVDPIQEDVDEGDEQHNSVSDQPYLHPIPQQLPALRTILPLSVDPSLSPLSENPSHSTLNDTSNSVSSRTAHSPIDTGSNTTSRTSFDPPKSLLPFSSSFGGVKRSDSWWSRFARTSFLDRRSSVSSRGVPEFRDPNPPPRLHAIEESARGASVDHTQSGASGTESSSSSSVARRASVLQGSHNKSLSSVRTTDTAAIERMAQTMDVAHLMRSDSRRTSSTTTTMSSIDPRPVSWLGDDCGVGSGQTFSSPVDMTDAEGPVRQVDGCHSTPLSPSSIVHPPTKRVPSASSGAVAAMIQEFERRQSNDSEAAIDARQPTKHRMSSRSVNYGLVPRQSLFVANPDHRTSSSDDTSS
ncbi:hypothetical protein H0H92_005216 [Tricholoma furcatifolium]|nr:hypothetical protein H0H92_005216 [Tricholoma furcatifolium]